MTISPISMLGICFLTEALSSLIFCPITFLQVPFFFTLVTSHIPCYHLSFPRNGIADVLDVNDVCSHDGGFRRYLIRWKDRPDIDDTWITKTEFCQLDIALLDDYFQHYFPEESSFQPGMNDEDRCYGKVYSQSFRIIRFISFDYGII